MFCPRCKYPLISSCTKCKINQKLLNEEKIAEGAQCNHFDRVNSSGTSCYYMITPKAFILLLYQCGYDEFLPCVKPSQISDLVNYCKITKGITPFTDMNSGRLLGSYGYTVLEKEITMLNVHTKENNVVKNDKYSKLQEELLFNAKSMTSM